jgi:hypothetical protein
MDISKSKNYYLFFFWLWILRKTIFDKIIMEKIKPSVIEEKDKFL